MIQEEVQFVNIVTNAGLRCQPAQDEVALLLKEEVCSLERGTGQTEGQQLD